MLSIQSLRHAYSDTTIEYPDWEVKKGEHSLILGNSGSGKTTLLHIIGGLRRPSSGVVLIDGVNITEVRQAELDRFRGTNIGIVFQQPHLVRALSVQENLLLAQYLATRTTNKTEAVRMMEQLGIGELRSRKVHQISQGQAQRVSIARALLNKPKLLLADEPTASLDDENCEKVIRLLIKQAELSDTTLIVATHDHRIKDQLSNSIVTYEYIFIKLQECRS